MKGPNSFIRDGEGIPTRAQPLPGGPVRIGGSNYGEDLPSATPIR